MLRSALALLSTLQVGGRVKQSFDRLLRQALIVVIAAAFIVAAAVLGLLAAYRELVTIYPPPEAALLMALLLLLLGLLALAVLPLIVPSVKPRRNFVAPRQATPGRAVHRTIPSRPNRFRRGCSGEPQVDLLNRDSGRSNSQEPRRGQRRRVHCYRGLINDRQYFRSPPPKRTLDLGSPLCARERTCGSASLLCAKSSSALHGSLHVRRGAAVKSSWRHR